MISQQAALIQNKIVGAAIRNARTHAELSVEACAEAASISPEELIQAEMGQTGLTLPQIEVLAHLLGVPILYLLGETELPPEENAQTTLPYENVMVIRRKIIGVILRQTRLNHGRTLDEVASATGYSPEHLARIELGEALVSMVELRDLGETLGLPFDTFLGEDIIPLTAAQRDARDLRRLAHLPFEVREFILKPINAPYLQIAMNLSNMPSESLHQIASGLLEITY
ncbi:MAG: transcriptional regulator [Anaerolineae bacterium]|nr:transcriptional regulator [Anaerolineae bacterium]